MTNGIYTLELRNFKAFPELQQFKFEGKHVLMYGENGSGKSSIYWALYTLLQSTVPNKDFGKYFRSASPENLMNQQMISRADSDSYIQFSLLDRPEHFFKLSNVGLTGDEANSNRLISETNLASDFISHRLLTNVYNFRNSDEIDLFTVFERDVFPFLENAARENYSDLQKRIERDLPFIETHGSLKLKRDGNKLDKYLKDIEAFNGLLRKTIGDLNQVEMGKTENRLTNFYNEYLAPKNHNDIKEGEKLKLELILEPMSYDFYNREEVISGVTYNFTSKDARLLKKPKVKIKVQRELEGSWRNINRPQSFFNEARLTRIALAIRFCILDFNRTKTSPTKILALDDLLISLDMSNRETVLDFLLSKYQYDFQLIILTHERAFFHLAKRKIEKEIIRENRNLEKEQKKKVEDIWKFYEIYEHVEEEKGYNIPKVYSYENILRKAKRHFKHKDYPACANYLRSYLESWFQSFLPSNKQKDADTKANYKMLNDLTENAARPYFEEIGFDTKILDDIIDCKDMLLNPLSHSSSAYSEVYKVELEKVFEIVEKRLPLIKNDPIFETDETIILFIQTNEGVLFKLYWRITDDFRLFKDINEESVFDGNFKAKFSLQKSDIDGTIDDTRKFTTKLRTLEEFYEDCCLIIVNQFHQTPIRETDMTMIFRNANGDTIRQLIGRMY